MQINHQVLHPHAEILGVASLSVLRIEKPQ